MAARSRFILRYTGRGRAPSEHVAHIRNVPGANVVGETDNMLLVDGPRDRLEQAARSLKGWVLSDEKSIPVPDTRKRVKRAPK
jgi:hypothetical protein